MLKLRRKEVNLPVPYSLFTGSAGTYLVGQFPTSAAFRGRIASLHAAPTDRPWSGVSLSSRLQGKVCLEGRKDQRVLRNRPHERLQDVHYEVDCDFKSLQDAFSL